MKVSSSNVLNPEFNFIDKIKLLISNPNLFFEKLKFEEGIIKSLSLYAIVGLLVLVFSLFTSYLFSILSYSSIEAYLALGFFVLGILFTFITSFIIHIAAILLKGQGTYANTYNVYVYSSIPSMILSLIPLIGWLSIIYSLFLITIGLSKVHQISKIKAVLSWLVPLILFFILIIILISQFLTIPFF